jgi:ATP-dependent helicase YprA (DUF1998 family)
MDSQPRNTFAQPTLGSKITNILQLARDAAVLSWKYDSQATRQAIENKFKEAFDGKVPYSWQIDITEALLLGLDCVVIAGTGAGKTMPFGMPLLMDDAKKKMVIVISPLNELELEQVCPFEVLLDLLICNVF